MQDIYHFHICGGIQNKIEMNIFLMPPLWFQLMHVQLCGQMSLTVTVLCLGV